MKNLKQTTILVLLALSVFLSSNCENTAQTEVSAAESLESILFEISELGKAKKKIVTFEILFNKQSSSYAYDNVRVIKESKKAMDFVKGANPGFKYAGGSYKVSCTDAEGTTETILCEDYACVGYAVAVCVESGGFAEICKTEATYYPPELE